METVNCHRLDAVHGRFELIVRRFPQTIRGVPWFDLRDENQGNQGLACGEGRSGF